MQGKYLKGLLLGGTLILSGELAQEILQELTEAGLHGQRAAQLITQLQKEAQHQPAPSATPAAPATTPEVPPVTPAPTPASPFPPPAPATPPTAADHNAPPPPMPPSGAPAPHVPDLPPADIPPEPK